MEKIISNKIEQNQEQFPGISIIELESLKKVLLCFDSIKEIILFGSRTTENYKENSDLDIYLEINNKDDGQISDIKNRIQQMLASKIPYPIHIKEKKEINNRQLIWNIKNNGKHLFIN